MSDARSENLSENTSDDTGETSYKNTGDNTGDHTNKSASNNTSDNISDNQSPIIDFAHSRKTQLQKHDHLVRGVAADGMIRAIAMSGRETVEAAHANHNTSPVVSAALGRTMMAAQMMAAMFKSPDELLTLQIKGDGPIRAITVTANNLGHVKGFAAYPNVWLPLNDKGKLDVGTGIGKGTLTVIRDLPGTTPYSSQTELVSGEIGDDLAAYFTLSDQTPTSVGVGVLVNPDTTIRQAGGFIVQLMPDYEPYIVDDLEKKLESIRSVTQMLEDGMTPHDILQHILGEFEYKELEVSPAAFHCGCNKERASRATLALGSDVIRDMISQGETAEVHCHFCGKDHRLSPAELQELLDSSERL
ncbi:MAG: Hsp33 family molecular chaperone HslO [Atopobiaceae bacterium]|nr:Hsp33 family molecular chaperone HslO [Atopobiaceae bacterium]